MTQEQQRSTISPRRGRMILNQDKLEEWLLKHRVFNYIISKQASGVFLVDTLSSVELTGFNAKLDVPYFPFDFGEILGDFKCSGMHLKTLAGGPKIVRGNFTVRANELTSLEYAPEIVEGAFDCSHNKIGSCDGIPKLIGRSVFLNGNSIAHLRGLPGVINGNLNCANNKISSIDASCLSVHGDVELSRNSLTSLQGAPEVIDGHLDITFNKIKNLVYFPKYIGKQVYCLGNELPDYIEHVEGFEQLNAIHLQDVCVLEKQQLEQSIVAHSNEVDLKIPVFKL